MLSYRHAFHAGNHADVLKHFVLTQVLKYFIQKDKPFWYIDTHAGAGAYALDAGYALKLAEYKDGIGRLWGRNDLPAALAGKQPAGEVTAYLCRGSVCSPPLTALALLLDALRAA